MYLVGSPSFFCLSCFIRLFLYIPIRLRFPFPSLFVNNKHDVLLSTRPRTKRDFESSSRVRYVAGLPHSRGARWVLSVCSSTSICIDYSNTPRWGKRLAKHSTLNRSPYPIFCFYSSFQVQPLPLFVVHLLCNVSPLLSTFRPVKEVR